MTTRALLIACVLAGACRGRGGPSQPAAVDTETGRFPHARHAKVACVECHPASEVLAGRPARPGTEDHAPCDRGECHQAEFMARPGRLCRVCHAQADPTVGAKVEVVPYPPATGRRALAAEFSHERHLDFGRMEERVGFHVACSDCHLPPGGSDLHTPDHAVCGRCHAPEARLTGAPVMIDCARCHRERERQPSRLRAFIVGDLRFDHAAHQQDRAGRKIGCPVCHTASSTATATGDHPAPSMPACVACHDDDTRTPADRRMRVCETCHLEKQASFGSIAPRSHLPALERPEDHTRAFRRDHAADAASNPKRCARCHTFMSGSARDTCDDCHRVMRPQDHTVTWREFDHGSAAATRTDNCSTCHQADFCVSCHRVRPRSHFPIEEFADGGGHGFFARENMRACVTCHVPDVECSRAGCHDSGAP
ncbi:MAG TPA: hypothetical protein VMZ28_31350 [Kofleriaceae bacterium]|nr:hypothetical protein [Kofleriaceae bacterium]